MTATTITTAAELEAVGPDVLLRGGRGYDTTHVVTYDLGDGELAFGVLDPGPYGSAPSLPAADVIAQTGPLTVVARADAPPPAAGRRLWDFVYFVVLGLGTKEAREEYRARSRWTTPPEDTEQKPAPEGRAGKSTAVMAALLDQPDVQFVQDSHLDAESESVAPADDVDER